MAVYYNENDPFAAAWLRNLIADGHVALGDVDERSIVDVEPDDLEGYAQHHFFAGIGGWSCALRLAGWDDARPVWTGSCPCQPFSGAGKRKAGADERHLWPVWFRLIRECCPDRVFGEQVESASGLGWWDRVSADLEAEGYAVGAAVLGAHSVGAPHIRQRLFWVADADEGQRRRFADGEGRERDGQEARRQQGDSLAQSGGVSGGLGDASARGWSRSDGAGIQEQGSGARCAPSFWSDCAIIPCRDGKARRTFTRLQYVADGLLNGLVRGSPAEKEIINASSTNAGPDQDMFSVRHDALPQAVQWRAGKQSGVQSPQVLRQEVHGNRDDRRAQEADDSAHEPQALSEDEHRQVRALWLFVQSACSSQGREPTEQRTIKSDDLVHVLSHQRALAHVAQDQISATVLQALSEACATSGLVQYTLHALSAKWRSLAYPQAGEWQVATGSPLAYGVANRVGQLRGYGNAIVPQVAAAFILAALEAR